jgi:hypothetical protein
MRSSEVGDSEKTVDAAAMVAEMKAKHAAEQKRFEQEFALADMEAKTTILAKPIDLPSAKVVPIKRADQKPKASKDEKLKTIDIDVSEIEVVRPDVASVAAVPSKGTIDLRGTPLEKTMNALRSFDIPFRYDLFHDQYLVGDQALQLRIGENIDHAILVLRTGIIKKFYGTGYNYPAYAYGYGTGYGHSYYGGVGIGGYGIMWENPWYSAASHPFIRRHVPLWARATSARRHWQ